MKVFLVFLEMLREVADSFRQNRNLHLGRPGVTVRPAELFDEFRFTLLRDRHRIPLESKN